MELGACQTKKIAKQRTFMHLPASINFQINRQRYMQRLVSVKRLETAPKHPSRRVVEVNKFGWLLELQPLWRALSNGANYTTLAASVL